MSEPNNPTPLSDAKKSPFGVTIPEMDMEAFLNMRDWLEKALLAAGAKDGGGRGIGCGQADVDIELDGHRYNVSIRPLKR